VTAIVLTTGQTKSYDETGSEVADGSVKDDGFYQKGVEHNCTRDDANGVVTDYATGLMWQDDYSDNGGPVVSKRWLATENYSACYGTDGTDGNDTACFDTSGDTAATYCEALTLAGHTDWRLPSVGERESIVDYGSYAPALDTDVFQTGYMPGSYWTATTREDEHLKAWVVLVSDGIVGTVYKQDSQYVRCVRNTQ
jgi:hypothetical protein